MKSKAEFSNEWFDEVREQVSTMLLPLGDEIGFDIQAGGIRYEPGMGFKLKLEFSKRAAGNYDPKKEKWDKYCSMYNLTPEMYGKEFTSAGERYRIVGLNTAGRKNTVEVMRLSDEKLYITNPDEIRRNLYVQEDGADAQKEWAAHSFMLGLKDVPFGAEFTFNESVYQISGMDPHARTYKVLGKNKQTGEERKFKPETVRAGLIK